MRIRGISYDADPVRSVEALDRDLRVIGEQLHCTTVLVFGSDLDRLTQASERALAAGLDVWFQPRLQNRRRRAVLAHLERGAVAAERLRAAHPERVVFVAGCEHSLFTRGMLPGPHVFIRLRMLRHLRWLRPRVERKLGTLLREAASSARRHFDGPVTYAAAFWEDVDWSAFDLVSVNLYRFAGNAATYPEHVRALVRGTTKPVVITEFGCCPHRGAEHSGPGGFLIVKWWAEQPQIKPGHVRDEAIQAAYLRELVAIHEAEGVDGAFAFTFAMPAFPHRPDDPLHDLDMASFGLVKVAPDDPSAWEPKAAFGELARLYGDA